MFGLRDFRNFTPDRQYMLNRLLRILSFLLAVFLIFYLFYHIGDGFQTKLETDFAQVAESNKTLSMSAYIFRDESVISTSGGTVRYYFDDYEKIEAGGLLATVYTSTSLDTQLNVSLIDALETRIELLTEAGARAQLLADTEATDREIGNALASLNQESEHGRYGGALQAAESLLLQMARKELQQTSKNNYANEIAALTATRDELDTELSKTGTAKSIYAGETGGYFTRSYDGYEDIFDYDSVLSMSISEFKAMTEAKPVSSEGNRQTIGKTINNYEWYIVAQTDRTNLDLFKIGKTYAVDFPDNDNGTMTMNLVRTVKESGSRDALLVFSCTSLPSDFSYTRNQKISVAYDTVSGLQVSRSAVHMIDGHPFVYTLFGPSVVLKSVDILDRVGGYYYIDPQSEAREIKSGKNAGYYSGLRENDCIVVYGVDLYHHQYFK